ncbi:hypothetical protein C8J57DRAFT_1359127 [Mycena rebaudengoi]|nr:hypothetical protein C8J57DRAFT_1359127 [Mycena rebaudengoi]
MANTSTISHLVLASNKHTANTTAMGSALNDIVSRLRTVEGVATALQATVESQANTIQTLIRRASDSTGWASAPKFNTNGKRALADIDGDDAAKRQQLAPPPLQQLAPPPVAVINIVEPPAFSYPTAPAPAFAYPMAPPAPAYAAPGFAPVALPTAPPDAPYVLPNAPPPPTRTLPVAPSAPGAPPRVPPNPAREAGLGPMDWQGDYGRAPRNLILAVLGKETMRTARFTSRKGADAQNVIVVFEADSVASWFIQAWNSNPRRGYECCFASPMPLNT